MVPEVLKTIVLGPVAELSPAKRSGAGIVQIDDFVNVAAASA
jgi:hypothetical protein